MQYVIDGALTSALILPVAFSFMMIYRSTEVLHFAHGAIITFGGYVLYLLFVRADLPLWLAVCLACALSGILGMLVEALVYARIRRQGGSGLVLFLASLGTYVAIVHILALLAGEGTYTVRFWPISEGWSMCGARVPQARLIIAAGSLLAVCITAGALILTRLGSAAEAVADDSELARIVGLPVGAIRMWSLGIGSALAGWTGVLIAFDAAVTSDMGMNPLLTGVIAALVGGKRLWGLACGALLLGMTQHVSAIWLAAKWQSAISFLILLAFLVISSRGFCRQSAKRMVV